MAKSQYSVKVEPYLELIEGWTREGLVMSQIAENWGLAKQHYTNTCKNILNFLNA